MQFSAGKHRLDLIDYQPLFAFSLKLYDVYSYRHAAATMKTSFPNEL